MDISKLLHLFSANTNIAAANKILNEVKTLSVRGLHGSSKPLFAASLFGRIHKPYVYVLNNLENAGYFYHDLTQALGDKDIHFFPSGYKRAAKYGQIDPANEILRTEVLERLQERGKPLIIVTYPEALAEKVISQKTLKHNTLTISVGEQVGSEAISKLLDSHQFEYVDYVYEPGQYATRGSILDVFSYSSEFPYRIDFFGDDVETIRSFDVDSQLSQKSFEQIRIVPHFGNSQQKDSTFFDALHSDTIIGFEDMQWIDSRIESVYNDELNIDLDEIEVTNANLLTRDEFQQAVKCFQHIRFDSKLGDTAEASIQFNTKPQPLFQKNFDLISESLKDFIENQYTIYILSDSAKQQERLRVIFEDRGDKISFTPINKTLHEGFVDDTLKICCFTDHQIFNRYHKYNLKSDKVRSGKIALSLKEINQFQIGDFVVHMDHGIGKFAGLVRLREGENIQEVIKLTYLNNDAIFVSIHSLHKISKYKGKEGDAPTLNKIGSGAWEKVKQRTKSKIKDIARDLIKLYAQRNQEKGFAYSPDSYLQTELEASFKYEDTPDQLKATNDVKSDMEKPVPMDRLVCGDVGFGKTEIAIRAAFKAATDGKQTAVLVPTTVLATQHYNTFSDRLSDFPCTIDYLSRARSPKEQRALLADLKEGKIDILIGTHRLVGKDVLFKDLGLLIIDEEQKFGVTTKEKLKQMRVNVDTLTMTATPIPRTLQFSLMGSRDLTTISTPPPNRYPVQTEVHPFDIEIIKEAINFEVSRNGQVFVVNNRIQNIYEMEALIKREIPDIKIGVGHGQMNPKAMEKVISDFINHEFDVLISTTIIESGIDIPNVNTILVINAQNFGLSDLHQLRGRVGRSNRKAFCYLLAPPLYTLSSDSRRRLQAIENFSELGSGIHIAMQDLDIRGAGNLLGAEQSGFIADLGYETYQKILKEAMLELRNDEFSDVFKDEESEKGLKEEFFVDDVPVESDLELMFPVLYIPNDAERISIYRELDGLEKELEILDFVKRLEDRFGKIPTQGKELIRIVRLRRLAKSLGIEKVVLKNQQMRFFLLSNQDSPYYHSPAFDKLLAYVMGNPRSCKLREAHKKRSVIIKNVTTVEHAVAILEEIKGK
ncbi:MAG: transcription-repair coupling factor [Dysgonamonadaceae bacterium]|nr:transcription-repair coupling factor [Dysgonamonadaceae bacterium]MDD4727758.1 transcription-repair coupling factor [Dysgonamonadaceae bacterium]